MRNNHLKIINSNYLHSLNLIYILHFITFNVKYVYLSNILDIFRVFIYENDIKVLLSITNNPCDCKLSSANKHNRHINASQYFSVRKTRHFENKCTILEDVQPNKPQKRILCYLVRINMQRRNEVL